jgi:drug/metabolite transporter (DMT)-like permease
MRYLALLWNNGSLLIMIAATLWALDGIIRRSLFTLSPIIIVFYEHLIGALILLPFVIKQSKNTKVTSKELLLIMFVSLLSGVLGTLWFTTALLRVNFISFSVVFLLQKLQPIFAISTAAIFLKEKVNRYYLQWAVLAIVSAYFVTFKDGAVNFDTGSGTVIAALYALSAAIAWGSSTTFSKMILQRKSHVLVTGMRFLFTTPLALIGVLLLGQSEALDSPTFSQFLRLLLIALSTGMVALLIYYRGLKRTEVKIVTVLELIFPLLAILIDAFLYKTTLSITQYTAAGVLMYSMHRIYQLNRRIYDIQQQTN